jgi:hypothetical protein
VSDQESDLRGHWRSDISLYQDLGVFRKDSRIRLGLIAGLIPGLCGNVIREIVLGHVERRCPDHVEQEDTAMLFHQLHGAWQVVDGQCIPIRRIHLLMPYRQLSSLKACSRISSTGSRDPEFGAISTDAIVPDLGPQVYSIATLGDICGSVSALVFPAAAVYSYDLRRMGISDELEAFVQAILVTCVISSQRPEPDGPVLTVRVAVSVRLAYQLRYEPTKSVRTL